MSLSDFDSYSDSRSHSPPNDDDKWVDDDEPDPVQQTMVSDNSVHSKKSNKKDSNLSDESSKFSVSKEQSKHSYSSDISNASKKSKKITKSEKNNGKDSKKSQGTPNSSRKPNVKFDDDMTPSQFAKKKGASGYHPSIQLALSGNKLAFSDGIWHDVSDLGELSESIHPIVAESISLQKRAELLVRLISESEYEMQLIQNEMNECDEVIADLKKVLGEEDAKSASNETNDEESV
ncbi:hypothetical protein TRFO_22396 [Tritrichomonas foetus]|uniref:Uncharacterized protein n=1 Tax=Tritrichomonas foetus TaxID=1144522 RepID=A0A1J4KBX2_9EUKA|nr:hypothetical protein TRFO_22396 [Tritrichomonas foetus]|eukprot:OHT08905.1 hypothetical protein TRFO_22396 [Tritrichomonas foetus]